jgi:hypothetical protein
LKREIMQDGRMKERTEEDLNENRRRDGTAW